ncbi:MAG: sigma-54-dependent Fis family transcriptional regulator [Bacteroidaceae bacterium]|nr:sigma-54-dependent Fis family transcriptional regulator [Bacteroidaceae bacterium]MBR1902119.1 sigma-54-dependent Fis family transcriptional regulator [Bacteroidaceae bacterium]
MKKLDIDLQKLKNQYNIVGKNKALDTALLTAVQVAPTDLSVLIEGENGVGKEIIPRIIHDLSPCKNKKYLAINCGSIPEGTIDSELFGHEKGAFTNAISEHEGYFGAADGGTLFLDEIGELPMSTQARLLRVLETGEYIRVGSNSIRKTTARIIAATNINIPNAIREGKFRQDLYYRLCRVNITMPPLRERNDDAVLLFKKFAMDMATKYQMPEYIHLTPAAEEVVKSYKWPGNIRQLKNVVEQMSVLSEERSITPEVLAKFGIVPNSDSEMGITITGSRSSESQHDYEKEIKMLAHAVLQLRNEVEELKQKIQGGEPSNLPATTKVPTTTPAYSHQVPNISPTIPQNPIPATDMEFQTAEEVLEDDTLNINDMEKRNIIKSLQRNHYRRKDAADELGISVRTLYRKLKAYGIEE